MKAVDRPQTCPTPQCQCTNDHAQGFEACINCIIAANPGTEQVQLGQDALDGTFG